MAGNAEIHTLAAPYALHALPDDDAALFERHLADCPACRAEVDEIRETAARLGIAATVVPPSELKADVMRRILQVRPLPPVVEPTEPVLAADTRRRGWRRWWGPVATGLAAAMTAAVIVLGTQLADVQQDLDEARETGAGMQELIAASDMEMVHAEAGESDGMVMMSRSVDMAVVLVKGMEPAPDQHTYQVWFIGEDGTRSAGMMGDTDDGQLGPLAAHGVDRAAQIGITVEPAGGSEQPTTDPVIMIDLPT